jgi:antitoxin component of RelBE/YafQ-DinJ toxin-antitoxin module
MAKKTLNLTIEERIKERARRIAKSRGISISRLFEEAIAREEEPEVFTPRPGSAVERIMNAIPESHKMDDYDYDKLKSEALREKYGLP